MTIHIYFMVAGPQTPHAYHFSMSALAGRGAADAHKCLENKIGMKKEASEKWTNESEYKKKLWELKRKTMVLADGRPSKPLNNFTLIKDSSKSMCCCELLFMTKALVDAGWRDLYRFLACQ